MRHSGIVVTLALMLLLPGAGCGLLSEERPDVQDQVGTIEPFGTHEGRFVIRPEREPSIAYKPMSPLPPEVRQIGLRVIFSGNRQPFPEDPVTDPTYPLLEVTEIRAAE